MIARRSAVDSARTPSVGWISVASGTGTHIPRGFGYRVAGRSLSLTVWAGVKTQSGLVARHHDGTTVGKPLTDDFVECVGEFTGLGRGQLDHQTPTALQRNPHDDAATLLGDLQRSISGPRLHRRHAVSPFLDDGRACVSRSIGVPDRLNESGVRSGPNPRDSVNESLICHYLGFGPGLETTGRL